MAGKKHIGRRKRGPAKASPFHHGELRDALVSTARRIIEQEGVAALSLRAVARQLEVSEAAPYHHFANKQALLSAIADQGFRELGDALAGAAQSDRSEPAGPLIETGVAYVEFACAHPNLFKLMFSRERNALEAESSALSRNAARAYQTLETETARASGGQPEERSIPALLNWSIAHGLALLIIDRGIEPADYGEPSLSGLARQVLRASG